MLLILNDVAGSEILLILVFVLIFFGSKSIPGLARTLGKTIRQVKDASSEIQNEIKKSSSEMKKDLNLTGLLQETADDIKRPLDQYASDIENAVKYQAPNRNSRIQPSAPIEEIEEAKIDENTTTEPPIETKKEE
jgi:sec-independent protein translocase protein TatA